MRLLYNELLFILSIKYFFDENKQCLVMNHRSNVKTVKY